VIVLESKIAKKYAIAFLHVYHKECTPAYMETLFSFSSFLEKNNIFQATLAIPSLKNNIKTELIGLVAKKLQLSPGTKTLITLLLKSNRIDLLNEVVKKILFLYRQREKKYRFIVTISHSLNNQEKEIILSFISLHVKNHIHASFVVDKSLISGIKIEGNTLLWERSIAKQLRNIELAFTRQRL
jgi:ATP synthase F1 delta subunit